MSGSTTALPRAEEETRASMSVTDVTIQCCFTNESLLSSLCLRIAVLSVGCLGSEIDEGRSK